MLNNKDVTVVLLCIEVESPLVKKQFTPPFGLLVAASVLRDKSINVIIKHLIFKDDIEQLLIQTCGNAFAVGFTTMTSANLLATIKATRLVKSLGFVTFWGGTYATLLPELSLLEQSVDSSLNLRSNIILHDRIADCEKYFLDSKLIIARAGRNVASELLYLGIPAILVPTNASHRSDEQRSNAALLQRLSEDRIISLEIGSSEHYFAEMANKLVSQSDADRISWCPGNDEAISSILALLDRK